jgi:CMP/dCMP kinase
MDSTREFAPLIKVDDAEEIDTSSKNIRDVVDEIINKIYENKKKK